MLPPAQRAVWPLLSQIPSHFVLYGGTAVALRLGHLEALHPQTTNWMLTLQTLVFFKGGDLDTLPAAVKGDLEDAVRKVRDVPAFSGKKTPIGAVPA